MGGVSCKATVSPYPYPSVSLLLPLLKVLLVPLFYCFVCVCFCGGRGSLPLALHEEAFSCLLASVGQLGGGLPCSVDPRIWLLDEVVASLKQRRSVVQVREHNWRRPPPCTRRKPGSNDCASLVDCATVRTILWSIVTRQFTVHTYDTRVCLLLILLSFYFPVVGAAGATSLAGLLPQLRHPDREGVPLKTHRHRLQRRQCRCQCRRWHSLRSRRGRYPEDGSWRGRGR